MTGEISEQAKQIIIGDSFDWIQKFDPIDYLENQPMIKKLYEEKQLAIATNLDLEHKVGQLTAQIHEFELKNQKLSLKANEIKRQSIALFALSLISTILIGLGVNIATNQPTDWKGWVMISAAIVIEVIAFIIFNQLRN